MIFSSLLFMGSRTCFRMGIAGSRGRCNGTSVAEFKAQEGANFWIHRGCCYPQKGKCLGLKDLCLGI